MSLRVTVIAESDSYLKWSAELVGRLPAGTRCEVLLVCSPVRPSPTQRVAALAGTPFAGRVPATVSPGQVVRRVAADRPDVVLLACTGPTAHALQEALSRSPHRPVLVAGMPGIAVPARRRAWGHRGAVDLLVVHSRREAVEYEMVRCLTGRTGRVGLATLPFLSGTGSVLRTGTGRDRNRVVFATQAKVPRHPDDRVALLTALDRLATARPDLEVVVKTRGAPGELHTHHEQHHYADLLRRLVAAGRIRSVDRLVVASGPMAEHLDRAVALATVSSTAALEAMARDVPVLLVDAFGVGPEMINEVFVGSGCLAGLDALARGDFRHPDRRWLLDNYFHPPTENTWVADLVELREQAAAGQLPPLVAGLDPGRSRRRRRRDRMRLTPAGSRVVRGRQQVRRLAHRVVDGVRWQHGDAGTSSV